MLNITVIPKLVEKSMTNLNLSKVSGSDYFPVVILTNCEAEISYILAAYFSICLKRLVTRTVGRYHLWYLY